MNIAPLDAYSITDSTVLCSNRPKQKSHADAALSESRYFSLACISGSPSPRWLSCHKIFQHLNSLNPPIMPLTTEVKIWTPFPRYGERRCIATNSDTSAPSLIKAILLFVALSFSVALCCIGYHPLSFSIYVTTLV